MKLTKRKIREMVEVFGRPVVMADDGFSTVRCTMSSKSEPTDDFDIYYRSSFILSFGQNATHKREEEKAVKDKVAASIHDQLYGDIISNLHRIKHECSMADRDEIIAMLSKLIDMVDS